MVEEIKTQSQEAKRLLGGLEGVIADLEGATEAIGDVVDGGDLRTEVMEIEEELKGVRKDAKS